MFHTYGTPESKYISDDYVFSWNNIQLPDIDPIPIDFQAGYITAGGYEAKGESSAMSEYDSSDGDYTTTTAEPDSDDNESVKPKPDQYDLDDAPQDDEVTGKINDKLATSYCYLQPNNKNNDAWIILDNGCTIDVFHNHRLLQNLRTSNTTMKIRCNAGVKWTNKIGTMAGYGDVWYDENGIANILSLSNVIKKYQVTYGSRNNEGFVVHKPKGRNQYFKLHKSGLFYLDTTKPHENSNVFLTTVDDNKTKFTKRDVKSAELAFSIEDRIGRPSLQDYINIVKNNLLPNIPISIKDILNAEKIFGPNLGSLKGKTTRSTPQVIQSKEIDLPHDIKELYGDVELSGDIMFINKIIFFISISHKIKFGTAEVLKKPKSSNYRKGNSTCSQHL